MSRRRLGLRKRLALNIFSDLYSSTVAEHRLDTLFWECTLRCNLSCRHCGSDCRVDPGVRDMPIEDFLKVLDEEVTPHVRITDVRNFGAIARTCECAGADAIIIPSKNSVSVNADAMKTSAGALHTLPVCREQNLTNTIKYLKDCGFKIVAATEKGDYDYTKANYKDPVCIIMGAEDTGVPYEHLSLCDEWIKIPLMGKIESLNVSVAAGILIYEAVKQRGFTEDKTASAL